MRIEPGQIICGIEAIRLRAIFSYFNYAGFTDLSLSQRLEITIKRSRKLIQNLLVEDYIHEKWKDEETIYYDQTVKGAAVRLASAAPPIKRAVAKISGNGLPFSSIS